jgi:Tol biopolymer transport system component
MLTLRVQAAAGTLPATADPYLMVAPGTKLGPYEVLAPLGAGGMGEVYRARDSRLGRDVAIKVLPHHLSAQPEIRARFEREAKTISGLNHPNICTLFDVGREGETDFLVMELIEGETLADRLKRGPLSAAELLRFGTQIADALDRAHRAGIIHRDLKPGNVMLTRSGAKLMDFGLSRVTGMTGTASGSGATLAALTASPTMAQALTAEGTLLGTFQYMSPEQLEGKEADARSDIWALGCVLYEMATGRRAFEGRSQASLIAAILERQPAPVGESPSGSGGTSVVGGMPAGLDRLIRNCLAKDPEERSQTAHDVKLQLQGIAEGAGLSATSVSSDPALSAAAISAGSGRGAARLPWTIAAAASVVAVGALLWLAFRTPASQQPVRFQIGAAVKGTELFWPRVSPDGRFIVLQGTDSAGTTRAYARPLDQVTAVPIAGTEGLRRAYWSPDGREIVFVADDKLERAPLGGGSPTVICAAQGGVDLSWGTKGMILLDGQYTDSLRVVPASGGELKPATHIDRSIGEVGSGWPCFLPDGEHFLFIGNLRTIAGDGNIRLGKLGSLDSKLLGRSSGRVEYAPGGWVLYLRGRTLLAQKLDLGAGKLVGEPSTLADGIRTGSSAGHFSISRAGILAFGRDSGNDLLTMREANRSGKLTDSVLVTGRLRNPRLSPDGHRMLYQRMSTEVGLDGEIYVLDLQRATDTRLTFTGGSAATPEWSPDGRRFAYATRPNAAATRLRIGAADGLGAPDSIPVPVGAAMAVCQWANAGSRLVVYSPGGPTFAVPTEGASRVAAVVGDSTQRAYQGVISPDGRWLAFAMGTIPNIQIFVQSLSGPPGRWQISSSAGINPRWTRGGSELVYEGWDARIMAVDIDAHDSFRAGTPHPLFTLPRASFAVDMTSWTCDANADRFFLLVPAAAQNAGVIEVVTNFASLVKGK